jgi:hypothetical protein
MKIRFIAHRQSSLLLSAAVGAVSLLASPRSAHAAAAGGGAPLP